MVNAKKIPTVAFAVLQIRIKRTAGAFFMSRGANFLFQEGKSSKSLMLRYGNSPETSHKRLPMKLLPRHPINGLACLAIAALLSACGGGGTAEQPSTAGPVVAASTAPAAPAAPPPSPASIDSPSNAASAILTSDVPVPQPASAPAQLPWDDPIAGGYTVTPAAAPTDTGGEAPYPDLRMLPTRTMAFEPVVYGDVAGVAVTRAP